MKMNVLWVCNTVLPEAAELLNKEKLPFGGWFVSLSFLLANAEKINLTIAFPEKGFDNIKKLDGKAMDYYVFPAESSGNLQKLCIKKIVDLVNPDIIHIFGTEYQHTLEFLRCADLSKCVVNLQGLLTVYSVHYLAELPFRVVKRHTLRDFLKNDNIIRQKQVFEKQGNCEIQALQMARHCIGRTTWDYACVKQINPDIHYHFCNETLRDEFYNHQWDLGSCEKHSIFTSQGNYPIKGLHFLLEAMPLILKRFPDAKIYVGGYNVLKNDSLKNRLKISSYGKYIAELIRKNKLQNKVIITGLLDERQMCARMLKSHVFVSPSTVENESNSLSEAKIMGVPCVASYVGGVTDRIEHGSDGFFYQHDAPYMLAYYVCKIFESDSLAQTISENAKKSAQGVNNVEVNLKRLMDIYEEIDQENS